MFPPSELPADSKMSWLVSSSELPLVTLMCGLSLILVILGAFLYLGLKASLKNGNGNGN